MTAPRRISESELHAYVDGELAPEDRAEMEALLATSPTEAGLVRDFRDLNDTIRAGFAGRLNEAVPPAMGEVASRVPEPTRGRGTFARHRPWVTLAAALALVVLAGAAGYLARGPLIDRRPPLAAFVNTAIGAHEVYVPEVRHPVEVAAAEEAHLVQWLTKRIGANVRAPALSRLGWKLVGGRLLPDRGLPAAQFMYEDADGRRLTLYMRKETGLANTSFQFYERDGFSAFYWIDQPLGYALAGRLGREELMAVANAVYAQLDLR